MVAATSGYRLSQIALHWLVFVLVAFLFFTGDNMSDAWRAMIKNGASAWGSAWVPIHIVVGLAVFAAMAARIWLRRRYGAPPPPEEETPALRVLALGVHHLTYLLLLLAPIVGLIAFLFLPSLAAAHTFMVRLPLLILVGLHMVGAIYHQFVLRDGLIARMLRPISG